MTEPPPSNEISWYQLPVEQVFETLHSDRSGLTLEEATSRQEQYGYNELTYKKRSAFMRFLTQFNSPLIIILLICAVITGSLSMWKDANMWMDTVVILAVVLANTFIGFIQEGKAEDSVEALENMITPECRVMREEKTIVIQARDLVPGDIVLLEGGDRVPADIRLCCSKNLSADESAITGESVPVEKHTDPIKGDQIIADRKCMVFSGTFIARGIGSGIVVATGEQTQIGQIAELITKTEKIITPLTVKLNDFTRILVIVILFITALNFILALWFGYDLSVAFSGSVSLAVAAIPEGLPAVVTMALAIGVTAMARRNAIVKRLPAAETLGCTTVIGSDKTGTLTKNQMTVSRIYSGGKNYRVSEVGYEIEGEHPPSLMSEELSGTLKAGYVCNNASFTNEDSNTVIGDPTEAALLISAKKAGMLESLAQLDEIPFESEQQFMATLHEENQENVIYAKGSPERIYKMCQNQMINGSTEPLHKDEIRENVNEMAKKALRLLAMAYKVVPSDKKTLDPDDLSDMTFLGIQGMIDPPRDEVIEAIKKCQNAGIRVVMITGDYIKTAKAIASQLGINSSKALTGREISKMGDDELYNVVEDVSVYARVSPEHKFRITQGLQKHGHVVAVTGDGVNDAPALKAADIGIAMGISGTEVSKEASDMILTDDNFSTIVSAVEEGRYVYDNIKKVILFLLPTNGGQALLILGAIMLAPFFELFREQLPLEPVQILWINLIAAVALALPIIKEPMEKDLLNKAPRDSDERITDPLFFKKVGLVSLLVAVSGFAIYYYYGSPALSGSVVYYDLLRQAQTAAFTTVIMVHICYLITARSITESAFTFSPISNKWVLLGIGVTMATQLIIVYVLPHTGFNLLKTAPIPLEWWWLMILFAIGGFVVIEIEKWVTKRFIAK
ncbi:MAG: HAD-IC family P-type ATPase [Methanosarcinales archaeon]|nr:HAD-IC family P-type ATPase [Methanosarcinales archaeon]